MTAILYPVAANAEAALNQPLGRAGREREAEGIAGEPVTFVSEPAGPAYATREAALAVHGARVEAAGAEDRFCRLAEVLAPGARPPRPLAPAMEGGRRWPAPPREAPPTVWRLLVSYWRPASAVSADLPQARQVRRADPAELDAEKLRAIASQPLRPVKAQQSLDIGLFERRLPENPEIIVPDE